MARSIKKAEKATTGNVVAQESTEQVVATKPVTAEPVVAEPIKAPVRPQKKKFELDELIPCVSITPGELFMVGAKTDTLYTWANLNDVEYVEYQDLNYSARRGSSYVFAPRFIIQDNDFVELFPKLKDLYASLYTTKDLNDILKMSNSQINSLVPTLPSGAVDALKSIVMTAIDNGTCSDIKKIKTFDKLFNTNMLQRALNAANN